MTDRKTKTIHAPSRHRFASANGGTPAPRGSGRSPRERETLWVPGDPEAVRPLQHGEGMPIFVAAVFLSLLALGICFRQGYTLLYGDAVAHLGNARRILDAHYPGLGQLGGAWLPLPHLLMLPFIGNLRMWQTGLAAAPESMISFAASVVGIWRLTRRLMRLRWALVATLLYGLNANLLYLATTALTEALFLALFVWAVVATVETAAALRAGQGFAARRQMLFAGLLVLLMVFARYDGWVMGAAVWCCIAWGVWRAEPLFRRALLPTFAVFTLLCIAGPLLWFAYNAHFDGDWLDFLRGPYSAKAIEARTSRPGQHYPGWHNPLVAAMYYLRAVQVVAAAWELGWVLLAAAAWGTVLAWRRQAEPGPRLHADSLALLLWAPLPFYIYSVAYGSVPVFLPQLAPHAFYNARYGIELLPAFCVYAAVAGEWLELRLRAGTTGWAPKAARGWPRVAGVLCVLNSLGMLYGFGSARFLRTQAALGRQYMQAMRGGYLPAARRYAYPVVLQEGMVNAQSRIPFEHSLANVLETLPSNQPVLMSVTAHVGAVQDAGRELKSMISEDDRVAWQAALAAPAGRAAYVIAMDGDPVAKAVAEHPEGLQEIEVVRTLGQPAARIYQSTRFHP